jgi:hypothetical protein
LNVSKESLGQETYAMYALLVLQCRCRNAVRHSPLSGKANAITLSHLSE